MNRDPHPTKGARRGGGFVGMKLSAALLIGSVTSAFVACKLPGYGLGAQGSESDVGSGTMGSGASNTGGGAETSVGEGGEGTTADGSASMGGEVGGITSTGADTLDTREAGDSLADSTRTSVAGETDAGETDAGEADAGDERDVSDSVDSADSDGGPEPNLPDPPDDYIIDELPPHFEHFRAFDNTPDDNSLTNEGAVLGRVLFYDRRLSVSGRVNCGHCHIARHGFANPETLATGATGQKNRRNTLALVNLRWAPARRGADEGPARGAGLGWDSAAGNLEAHIAGELVDERSMANASLEQVVERISAAGFYRALFARAFPQNDAVSGRGMVMALAQFVRAMVSYRSKWDRTLLALRVGAETHDIDPKQLMASDRQPFSEDEALGYAAFVAAGCSQCHGGAGFRHEPGFANNGLDLEYRDAGLGALTGETGDRDLFRIPNLRAAWLSAPYMHDGRFADLGAVMVHYATGVEGHDNLDGRVKTEPGFTREQLRQIEAFLGTLVDKELLSDPKFSDPFP